METLSPRLRNSHFQDDIDAGVMMLHRNSVTNLIELEWLIATKRAVSFLVFEIIEDGKELGCIWITRGEASKRPKSSSPSSLKLAEFITGHFSFLLVKLRGGYGVPPMAYGWREPSHG
jgi:hypothetical protein